MDNWCKKSLVKYSCQMIILAIVIMASVVNLSLNWDENGIWLPLLCSSLGYIKDEHTASFSGPQKLYEAAVKQHSTVTLNAMKSWLSGEETYTFHKPSRKKFKRNKVIVGTIDQQWDIDLMDMHDENCKIQRWLSLHSFSYRHFFSLCMDGATQG